MRAILADKGLRASKHNLRYYDIVPPTTAAGASLYALPYHWPTYDWLHALEAAALGDYAQARAALAAVAARTLAALLCEGRVAALVNHDRARRAELLAERQHRAVMLGAIRQQQPRRLVDADGRAVQIDHTGYRHF